MKKSTKIIIAVVIAVVLIIVAAVICVFTLVNKEKPSITAEEFKTKMESKGYHVMDATAQFANYDYVEKVYIASSEDYSYKLEFYELSDATYANNFYHNNKAIFEASKGNVSVENSVEIKNYAEYNLTSNNKYMAVSRINGTVLYVSIDATYKDNAKAVMDELGY